MRKMNKSQFIKYVAETNGLTQGDVRNVFDAVVKSIAELTADGYELSLAGFGVFFVKVHKGHPVRFTRKVINVNDYAVLKFSSSNTLNRNLRKVYTADRRQ